jgi:F1F0 ATPase subunit 2
MGLGLIFFGGLWLTIRWLPTSRWPVVLTLGSLLGRMAVTLVGFYLVLAGRWERLLACLVGFVLSRYLVVALSRPEEAKEPPAQKEEE